MEFFSPSSSSSDFDIEFESTSDFEENLLLGHVNDEPVRAKNIERLIQNYSEMQFQANFRLSRTTMNLIIEQYHKDMSEQNVLIGPDIPSLVIQIYMTVWCLANQETFREVAEKFGYPKTIVHKYIFKTTKWIVLSLSGKYLSWPSLDERKIIQEEFKAKRGIPNVICAIDCSHIKILSPRYHQEDYYNRKQFHSIHLQGVVDDKNKFIDVSIGQPGSMHDSRVLRHSKLLMNFNDNLPQFMSSNQIILGDLAYPASYCWLVPPYKDFGSLTSQHKKFNYLHSSTRIVVEKAFGLLKGRFRRLRGFDNTNLNFIKMLVGAAIILHNICIEHDDYWSGGLYVEETIDSVQQDDENSDDGEISNTIRRDKLFLELQEISVLDS